MRIPSVALALTGVILAAATALAQSLPPAPAGGRLCGNRAQLVAELEKEWGEAPAAIALDAAGNMVQILANPDTATWSMLVVRPSTVACLVSHGTAWESIAPPADPGDPS